MDKIEYSDDSGVDAEGVEGEGDFFSGEDLDEVEISGGEGDDGSGEALGENYGSEGSDGEMLQEYGDDDDEEDDDGEVIGLEKDEKKGKGSKDKKDKRSKKSNFAAYEDFAHLLEDGLDEEDGKQKERKHFSNAIVGQKRPFSTNEGGRGGRGRGRGRGRGSRGGSSSRGRGDASKRGRR